jgi:RimJ/RimL family protein N-acetyltransferase
VVRATTNLNTSVVAPDDSFLETGASLLLESFKGCSNDIRQLIFSSQQWLGVHNEFRQLGKADSAEILVHFKELPSDDIILRFGRIKSESQLSAYVRGFNYEEDVFMGAMQDGKLVGFCHMAVYPENGCKTAEIGISVLPEARGKGLASKLMAICFGQAGKLGVANLHIHYLLRNRAMAALCKKYGARLSTEAGEVTATLTVHDKKFLEIPKLLPYVSQEDISTELDAPFQENVRKWYNPLTWVSRPESDNAVAF